MRLSLALLFLATASASAAPPETKTSPKGMTYSIRVPDGYAKGQHPLVVGLHGAGDNCQNFMRWLDGPQSTIPKDAVLLVPQALQNGAWDQADAAPLAELIRETQAAYPPTRTIGMGFSRGAYYLYALAFAAPDILQGAIPCAGGLPQTVPDNETLKKLPFYVVHGDADPTVPCDEGVKAHAALEKAGVLCKFEKVAGLKHTVDWAAVKRGLEWIGGILDERDKGRDEIVVAKIASLEKALKEKAWEAAAAEFAGLEVIPRKHAAKVAGLAKPHVTSSNEPLALAAIAAAGRCGPEGVPALKSVPPLNAPLATAAAAALGATAAPAAVEPLGAWLKTKSEDVACAAAKSLGDLGGDPAAAALASGLANAEALFPTGARRAAIEDALKKITGQSFAKASEWKKWLAERAKQPR